MLELQQRIDQIKSSLLSQISNLNLQIPQLISPSRDITSDVESLHNLSQEVKNAFKNMKNYIKTLSINLDYINNLLNIIGNSVQDISIKAYTSAEEILINNLSSAFQSLSQITSMLQNPSVQIQPLSSHSQMLASIQTLHSILTKTLKDYPTLESSNKNKKLGSASKEIGQGLAESLRKNKGFKEILLRDFGDIAANLKSTIANIDKFQTKDNLSLLTDEMNKNQDLQFKLESKNTLIHKLNLLFNEGLERVKCPIDNLIKLADSGEAQALLVFILNELKGIKASSNDCLNALNKDNNKLPEEVQVLEIEYANQRELWSKSIDNMKSIYEDRISKLMIEIEEERKSHENTYNNMVETQKKYKKSEDLCLQINELTHKLNDAEYKLMKKADELEETHGGRKDLERMKDELEFKNSQLQEINHRNNILQERNSDLKKEVQETKASKNQQIETLESKFKALQYDHQILADNKTKSDLLMRKTSEQIDHIKLSYLSEVSMLKEENNRLNDLKIQLIADVDKKKNDMMKFSDMMDELQEFSNKQLETLRAKEEKINALQARIRYTVYA